MKNLFIFSFAVVLSFAFSQNCIPAPKGMKVDEIAYRSPIVVKAMVSIVAKDGNHTAKVTEVFQVKSGGLSKGDVIYFGPVKKSKSCPRIKKNVQYILFLEPAEPADSAYHRIKYNPEAKLKYLKKLKKTVLCRGCVKAPKIKSSSHSNHIVAENSKFKFDCKGTGSPKPTYKFYKDGEPLGKKFNNMKIKSGKRGKIQVKKIKKLYEGNYTCEASNFVGSTNYTFTLIMKKDDCMPCPKEKENYCLHGRCCYLAEVNESSCSCEDRYTGPRCGEKTVPIPIAVIEARYRKQTIAVLGICIALLLVVFICYVVYCKFKKSRSKIRKEIMNGHLPSNAGTGGERIITESRASGILGDNAHEASGIHMTGYHSTALTEAPQQPRAFTQRPQTYDEVILSGPGMPESEPLMQQQLVTSSFRTKEEESKQDEHLHKKTGVKKVDSKRSRLKGIAFEHTGAAQPSTSEQKPTPKEMRAAKLKADLNSLSSSASSLNHHDSKKPVLPMNERLAQIARTQVQEPPAYHCEVEETTITVKEEMTEEYITDTPSDQAHYMPSAQMSPTQKFFPTSPVGRDHVSSSVSSGSVAGSTHKVTTFDTDGRIQEEMLGREDGSLQGLTPHSPNLSEPHPRSPRSEVYIPHEIGPTTHSSLGHNGGDVGHQVTQNNQHGNNNKEGNVYPYYEHKQDHPGTPSNPRRESEDIFPRMDISDTSLGLYSPKSAQESGQYSFAHPSSPRQYRTSPEMSMGVPYRHAPVVASARHHRLPLLTDEKSQTTVIPDNNLLAGSTVSLSTSSNVSSEESQRHRDSHKIEV